MSKRIITGIIVVAVGLAVIELAGVGICGPGQALGGQEDSWAAQRADYGVELSIKVSPSTVNFDSLSDGDWLTVHTDIAYSIVDIGTLELNGVLCAFAFADDRGCLVAKFSLASIRQIIAPPAAVLTLTGYTVTGLSLEGSDILKVLNPQE